MVFEKAGWEIIGQVGSHVVMTMPALESIYPYLSTRNQSVGTLRALIRNAGLSVDEFMELL